MFTRAATTACVASGDDVVADVFDELLDLPMSVGSPCLSSSIDGTATRGARSEKADKALARAGRRVHGAGGGGDEPIPVDDVGMGVGYFCFL